MRRTSAFASVFLLLLLVPSHLTLRCHLHHEIWEDGHKLEINPDICSSNRYCVFAVYRDPDPVKKNGYSLGCDRVDCEESDDPRQAKVWLTVPGGRGVKCRKHRDYGIHGEICCCKTDMCNEVNTPAFIPFISPLFALFIFVW
ncbi:hypothetical protein KIN20_034084 [Parelaphostrongylus tenuis]|uniref:Uncharacterized protein n=1 Tax=Parelaphostrongylus tenuis TaxID=148309 RepID=A0AAD5R942_PARTN|nr:hypothetical protein KIN20_034084 [Parelaphostrongylus tenuis]